MLTHPFTWSYLQAADQEFDLPVKEKSDICTIMYTSGTTGDPKGVLISNASIICLIAGVDRLLSSQNEEVRCSWSSSIMWPYLTHWQTFNIFYNMRFSVGRKRRLHVLPSSCTHFWSCCGGIVYFPWCLYWILARGKHQWHCSHLNTFLSFYVGAPVTVTSLLQDVKLLVEDIGVLKPTIMCAVPRVLDRIFSGNELVMACLSLINNFHGWDI
jgi:acyl-CoA synthetase (AMP-forming)/AMP-acid ligase II